MNDIEYMKIAYEEAVKAYQEDEVPIGAIIVKDDKVIVREHNRREQSKIATHHAETLAIEKACKLLGTWHLDGCTLYTTLEPCLMCSGTIINSRLDRVVYGASENRWLALGKIIHDESSLINHHPIIVGGIMDEECSSLIKKYFKSKRY